MKVLFYSFFSFLLLSFTLSSSVGKKTGSEVKVNKQKEHFKYILHKSDTRGQSKTPWLLSRHTFSFNRYYDPERMNFGTLRVLNDDYVDKGKGFGTHPHDNMEIISIVLEGAIEHEDNMGNKGIIKAGDVQIMSAGTGITHSEYNHSKTDPLKFLQIWVFPDKKDVKPRYEQINGILNNVPVNTFKTIVSPTNTNAVFLYQNAVFSIGEFNMQKKAEYSLAYNGNGVYAFILEGSAKINGIPIERRDGIGIWETNKISIETTPGLKILLMDVPMID
ncbi:MAG: pirin family protein [Cytophagaceae bacterium]